jgi:ribosomal protein S18 acetylase RimI-like enzyme
MHIRPASLQELEIILGIVKDATRYMDEQGIAQWDEFYPTREILSKDIDRKEMHVIEVEGKIAGFIVLNEYQESEYASVGWKYPGRSLVVHRLTIHPALQRRGLASRLMDFAEALAAEGNYDCIRLDAFTRNPAACSLYKNRGYAVAGAVRFRKGEFYCFEKKRGGEEKSP